MQRLVQLAFPTNAVTKPFLTHLHSDHVVGVPDLMLTPWSAAPEWEVPLEIWGPDGTRAMTRSPEGSVRLRHSYAPDRGREPSRPTASEWWPRDIQRGEGLRKNGVTVTALRHANGLVSPCIGYRVAR